MGMSSAEKTGLKYGAVFLLGVLTGKDAAVIPRIVTSLMSAFGAAGSTIVSLPTNEPRIYKLPGVTPLTPTALVTVDDFALGPKFAFYAPAPAGPAIPTSGTTSTDATVGASTIAYVPPPSESRPAVREARSSDPGPSIAPLGLSIAPPSLTVSGGR